MTRVFSWRPYEISLLTKEPADDSVGINRAKKRQCPDCDGSGRCRCRAKDEDVADDDCDCCGGRGKCPDCGGNGYFESARSESVDFEKLSNAEKDNLRKKLMAENTQVIVESEVRADERNKTKEAVAAAFKTRAKEITSIADKFIQEHGTRKLADGKTLLRDKVSAITSEALQSDEALSDFKMRCMTEVLGAKPVEPVYVEDCTDERGVKEYSLMRGIQSCLTRESKTPDGLEGEVHAEYLKRCEANGGLGFQRSGFLVPAHRKVAFDGFNRGKGRRDMQATLFASGGATVPTILMTPIIELLRNRMVLSEAGVRTLGGLSGNVVIPRQDAAATAYSVTEIGQLTASQQVLGQIALSPKRVGATETYSKQWLMQSSPDAEAFVRDDLFKVIALKWDLLGLNGQGAGSEPLGILNTPGVGTVTFGATPTYIKMIAFETAIRSLNVTDPLVYLSTSTVKGTLKGVAEALTGATTIGGSQNALWKPDNSINGYPAIDSQQIPNNLVICGAFSQLIHAMWGGLDVVVDQYTPADKGEVKISINTYGDFAVRHPQAFCVSTDAGNQ